MTCYSRRLGNKHSHTHDNNNRADLSLNTREKYHGEGKCVYMIRRRVQAVTKMSREKFDG